ncbi:hypothetical protein L3Q82_011418, partial [Scortum barcoo]
MCCLFEAYEHVLSLLERVFTPMFCHSDEYFRHLLRGAESPTKELENQQMRFCVMLMFPCFSVHCRNTSKRGETFGISRIGSKIKGVFKSTTMEGAILPPSAMNDLDEDLVEEATVVMEDDAPAEPASTPGSLRNLLAWSITIPFIDLYEDEAKREKIPVFCIDVERNDRKEVGHETEKWSVCRRYLEFYVLESKLTEFHEAPAASRAQCNSQLLADFLSPHSVESQFLDRMLPDVNLGAYTSNIYSLNVNLSREDFQVCTGEADKRGESLPSCKMNENSVFFQKGQNLEPFIQSFFNSCESPKPKPSRPELTILSPSAENNKKLFNDLFKNNANLTDGLENRQNHSYFLEMVSVDGMYDYMMYVGRVVFHMSDWLHHFLAAGRILFKNTFEAYMDQYMQTKLEQILQEHHMVSLITQLRDAVFCESSEERTTKDKQIRAKQTFEEMMKYLPDKFLVDENMLGSKLSLGVHSCERRSVYFLSLSWSAASHRDFVYQETYKSDFVGKLIGEEAKYEGIRLLFDAFQQPLLNKQGSNSVSFPVVSPQMTYVLLDIAVQELFPELGK